MRLTNFLSVVQDTDFEDECKEIVARRKRLTKKLKEDPVAPKTVRIDVNDLVAK